MCAADANGFVNSSLGLRRWTTGSTCQPGPNLVFGGLERKRNFIP
jgi:hypothetical protein